MNDELFQLTPRWVVITSPHNREHHGLFYAGKGYDTATGEAGLNRLRDAAELFNRHKKTPVERVTFSKFKSKRPDGLARPVRIEKSWVARH